MDWPGWAGVQGIASILGLIAIVIAVVDFLLRVEEEAPQALAFHVDRQVDRDDVPDPVYRVIVQARVMGPRTLHEPRWRSWGGLPQTFLPMPSVIDARDGWQQCTVYVRQSDLASVQVGLVWVVPRRTASHAGASRVSLQKDGAGERWVVHRWRAWPRRTPGRWKPFLSDPDRKAMNVP